MSQLAICNFGVRQGSILGPLLFLVFINDIFSLPLSSSIFSYADDTTLLISGSTLDDAIGGINGDLCVLNAWFSTNRIKINYSKSHAMLFQPFQSSLTLPAGVIRFNGVGIPGVSS